MHFLIIGFGSIGKRHAKNIANLNSFVTIFSIKKIADHKNYYKYEFIYDFEKINFQKFDGILICTPTSFHIKYVNLLIKYKIPIFIEKPISHNMQGLKKIYAQENINKFKFMIGFNFRYHPQLIFIKKIIKKNVLGKIFFCNIWWNDDLEAWYPNDRYKNNYSSSLKLGGGVLRTMCHEIDLMLWLFGKPIKSTGNLANYSNLELNNVEDYFEGEFLFPKKLICKLQMNFFTKVPQRGLTINASNGSLYWDYFRGKIEYMVGKKQKIINDYGIINNKKKNQMYVEEMIDFIKLCKSSKTYKSPISFQDGLEVQKIINKLS